MNKEDKRYFHDTLVGLGELFGADISQVTFRLYWEVLSPYPLDKFKKAVEAIIKTHKWPGLPKPADFIAYMDPPEDADARAELATREFFERLEDSGTTSFSWRDPVLAMTVAHLGGWHSVMNEYNRQPDGTSARIWLNDLKKVYKIYLKNPRPVSLRFTSNMEAENKVAGYLTDDRGTPVMEEVKGQLIPLLTHQEEAKKYLLDENGNAVKDGGRLLIQGTEEARVYLEERTRTTKLLEGK